MSALPNPLPAQPKKPDAPQLPGPRIPPEHLIAAVEAAASNESVGHEVDADSRRSLSLPSRNHVGKRIGEIIVALGFATIEQVESAVEEALTTRVATGRVLCDRGLITEDQLAQAIAARAHIVYVDLTSGVLEERALKAIDAATAAKYRAVPLFFSDDDTLVIAISEPSNVLAADEISLKTGFSVKAALTTEEQLDELLARLSKTDVTEATRSAELAGTARVGEGADDEAASANLLDSIFANAFRQRTSDIHVDPRAGGSVRVRFRIDGITQDSTIVSPALAPRLMARLKLISGMDISVKHVPQDGRAVVATADNEITLRVATLPTINGESAVLRVLDRSNVPSLERLGMDAFSYDAIKQALRRTHGAILATGPTGSGKTTSLYAALQELNDPGRAIITIEDPVEYPLDGVKQVQVDAKRGLTFASGLRTLLRSDPDVVMVGEIRDHETAKTAIEAALVGRLVLSTLHTNDAATAVTRLVEMGVERYLVGSAVECVIASRLARRLCTECRRAITVDAAALKDGGFDADLVGEFDGYEAVGCGRCGESGYRGRPGVFEVLTFDEAARELVVDHAPTSAISEYARENGKTTLRDAALSRVQSGTTSLAEAIRVTNID